MTTYSTSRAFSGLEPIATQAAALGCAVDLSGLPRISKANLEALIGLTLMEPSRANINDPEYKNKKPQTIQEAAKWAADLCTAHWQQHAVEITFEPLSKKVQNMLETEK